MAVGQPVEPVLALESELSAAFEELYLAADDSVGDVDELFCLLPQPGADVVEAVGVELPQVQPMPGPR